MDSRHAVIAVVMIAAGVAWWQLGHPGYETPAQKLARVEKLEHDRTYGAGQLYKWRDAKGVLQITDKPPADGRKYELVEIRQDQNVIPMGGDSSATATPDGREQH